MSSKSWHKAARQALGAAAVAALATTSAQASMMTLEGVSPGSVYFPGDSITEGGYSLTVNASASVVDTVAAFGAGTGLDLAAPAGNVSQFFIGLNDASATLKATNGSVFRLAGFDFAFVSALTGLFMPGDLAGLMLADYEDENGASGTVWWPLGPADAQGGFVFQTAGPADMGALALGVRSVTFSVCTADTAGRCVQPNQNFNQFALDNLRFLQVPEPGSLSLVALALGVAGGLRARRRAN